MKNIKEGEYIRTTYGEVGKYVGLSIGYDGFDYETRSWGHPFTQISSARYDELKSHSPNIIELVEIGDFVELEIENVEQKRFKTFWYLHGDLDIKNLFHHLENGTHRIVGIITKEQIMNMKYVVGDK